MSAEAPPRPRRLTVLAHDAEPVERAISPSRRTRPVLAVCGLAGGAGTTALAYLIALAAAQQAKKPVLVADTGGPSGGLAALAGLHAPRSLPELANDVAAGLTPEGGLYATGPGGVRVLATAPNFNSSCPHEPLIGLLQHAREAHELSVIDCGTLARTEDRAAVLAATHIAWIMPATTNGLVRATAMLDVLPRFDANEILVGRRDIRQPKAPLRVLRSLAAERQAPVMLVPHLPGLEAGRIERALEEAQVSVQAILGALRR